MRASLSVIYLLLRLDLAVGAIYPLIPRNNAFQKLNMKS